jgi:hypothetical protein
MWQPLISPNAQAKIMMIRACAKTAAGMSSQLSTVATPIKIKAKVPMNSADGGLVNPFITPRRSPVAPSVAADPSQMARPKPGGTCHAGICTCAICTLLPLAAAHVMDVIKLGETSDG